MFISQASRNVFITDPIGKTTSDKHHIAQSYDVAALLLKYAPALGSWAVAHEASSLVPDPVLEYVPQTANLVAAADSDTQRWVSSDVEQYIRSN